MKLSKQVFWGYLVFLSAAWWIAGRADWGSLDGIFAWRAVLSQYTGVIGIGVMSLAMLLTVRPTFLERRLGGLDKMYRLHKWLGISALVVAVGHWLIANGPKWLVALGWLQRRPRGPRPVYVDEPIRQFFMNQRGLAEAIGEWAFYIAVLMMVLALVKRFPYRRFFQTHRVLAATYLALVAHAVVLFKFEHWNSLLGVTLAALMTAGSIAAVMSLFRKHAGGTQVAGRVVAIERHPEADVMAVEVQLDDGWRGHQSGQFAFVTFHADEGPHPFTIASCWNDDRRIRFVIKALGDYTRSLSKRLQVDDRVKIEGPYGRFNFESDAPRQIWIGGGIGITPFIARMGDLARTKGGEAVDLFHTTAAYDRAAIDKLARDAAEAKVRLHVLWDARDGRLDAERLVKAVPDWRSAEVWFCGPAGFGRMLRQGLISLGFPAERFHQELFELR
ncbi:MAG: ferric reductase-like transmembrane domain-containing protein [Betaproteobacteria bacterium]|nr:ferric reductase-like transmembrane domain-containing protein [Betaproteobacteria bacterium]